MTQIPNQHADPAARAVDWPALVRICERRGIPALRVDHDGEARIIRTMAQLREWKDTP